GTAYAYSHTESASPYDLCGDFNNGNSYNPCTQLLRVGSHVLVVTATDTSGNSSAPFTVNFTVTSPQLSLTVTQDSPGKNLTVSLANAPSATEIDLDDSYNFVSPILKLPVSQLSGGSKTLNAVDTGISPGVTCYALVLPYYVQTSFMVILPNHNAPLPTSTYL